MTPKLARNSRMLRLSGVAIAEWMIPILRINPAVISPTVLGRPIFFARREQINARISAVTIMSNWDTIFAI